MCKPFQSFIYILVAISLKTWFQNISISLEKFWYVWFDFMAAASPWQHKEACVPHFSLKFDTCVVAQCDWVTNKLSEGYLYQLRWHNVTKQAGWRNTMWLQWRQLKSFPKARNERSYSSLIFIELIVSVKHPTANQALSDSNTVFLPTSDQNNWKQTLISVWSQ